MLKQALVTSNVEAGFGREITLHKKRLHALCLERVGNLANFNLAYRRSNVDALGM